MHHGVAQAQRAADPQHRDVVPVEHRFGGTGGRIGQRAAMIGDDHHQRTVPPRPRRRRIEECTEAGVGVVMGVQEPGGDIGSCKIRRFGHLERFVAAERENRGEERSRDCRHLIEQASQYDMIVHAPLRVPQVARKSLEARDPIIIAIQHICLHVREGKLAAVVIRGVISGRTHRLAELWQCRGLSRPRHDRLVRHRGKSTEQRHEALCAAIAGRKHRIEQHPPMRPAVELRRDVGRAAHPRHDLGREALPDHEDHIRARQAQQWQRCGIRVVIQAVHDRLHFGRRQRRVRIGRLFLLLRQRGIQQIPAGILRTEVCHGRWREHHGALVERRPLHTATDRNGEQQSAHREGSAAGERAHAAQWLQRVQGRVRASAIEPPAERQQHQQHADQRCHRDRGCRRVGLARCLQIREQ